MTLLRPLPGDPASVRALAASCGGTAERLAGLAGVLARLRDGAVWDGPAGDAFGAHIARAPGVLDTVARRFAGAVAPLRVLAVAMEDAQAVVGSALREHDEARQDYAVLEQRAYALVSAGCDETHPQVAHLRALQVGRVEAMTGAEARHAAATSRFHEVDRRCAATLSALAGDGIADPVVHRFLTAAGTLGRGAGSLGLLAPVAPEVAPAALAGDVLAFGADAALLLGYGEGDLAALGVSTGLLALGATGGVLRAGASAGAEVTAAGVRSTRSLGAGERVVLGGADTVRARVARVRKAFDVPPARGTPSHLTGGPPLARVTNPPRTAAEVRATVAGAARRARVAAGARADTAFRDQLRMATANGPGPRAMYVGGVTLLGAEKVGRKVAESHEREPALPRPPTGRDAGS